MLMKLLLLITTYLFLTTLLISFILKFTTQDLDNFSYFLNSETSQIMNDLFISHLKYTQDICTRAQLLDSKPDHILMVVS